MCNLYSLNKGQDHIAREFRVNWDDTGNLPPLPGIFPDMMAPIVRNDGDGRWMQMMRWGMPTPPKFLSAGAIDCGVTNIRNVQSAHWRAWLKPEFRCLVPVTSFSEPTDKPNSTGKKDWFWFALSEEPVRIRRHLVQLDRHAGHEEKSRRGPTPTLRLLDDRCERGGEADPQQGDARHPHGRGL